MEDCNKNNTAKLSHTSAADQAYLSKLQEFKKAGVLYETIKGLQRKPRFMGMTSAELAEVPHFQDWLNDKNSLALAMASSEVLEQIEANLKDPKSPQKVNTRDAQKALKDMSSAVGNYFGFWHKYKGLPPTLDLLYTPDRVDEWILWLEAYYGPGSTVQNKSWNVKNFVHFLHTNIHGLSQEEMQDLITCKRRLGDSGNRNKIQAALNRIMLADEQHMTAEGKFFTKEEGQTFFCWLVQKWGAKMDLFLKVRAPAEIAQLAVKSKQLRGQEALVMQRVLMGLMLYLGGGLRKQVFVNLYVGHLQWDEDEMVMQVGREKVAPTNTSHLPLPPQLFTYIEFFKQRLKILIKDFNPELTTTAIDFRCMTITNLFAEHVPLEEGETIEHLHNRFSDYLGVSVKIMKTVYNRHDLKKKHKGTLNAANAGKVPEGAQTAMGKMEAKMATAIVEEEKHQHIDLKKRQARTTEDDEEWQSVSGHLPKKRKRRAAYKDEEEEEEEEELEAEEDSQEEDEGEDEEEEEEEDEVESIQEMRIAQSGELELCVRWVGYSEEFDMWLPLTQLGNALACVEEFIKANFL